jgi:hypothetical protein
MAIIWTLKRNSTLPVWLLISRVILTIVVYALNLHLANAQGVAVKWVTSANTYKSITKITIRKQGSANEKSDDEPKGCAHFRLTSSEVSSFLRNTGEIDKQDYLHAIDWSPCAVSGSLKLADGRTGEWSIHKLRGGTLTLNDGSEFFLYCAKCKGAKFAK